jgi:uncharacterized protein HemY
VVSAAAAAFPEERRRANPRTARYRQQAPAISLLVNVRRNVRAGERDGAAEGVDRLKEASERANRYGRGER